MRIAIITAIPANVAEGSGTHVAAERLTAGLEAAGHRVTVIRPDRSSLPTATLRRFAFNWGLKPPGDVDLVVGFDMDGYRLAGRLHVPFVAYLHGIIADEARFEFGWVRRLLLLEARAERQSVERADLVLATSEYSRRRIAELYGVAASKIGVAPPPVDVTGWQREVAAARPAPHQAPVILAVAHWYQRKNLATLIHAAAIITRQHPTAEFRIVGQGPELQAGRHLAEFLGLRDRVRFLGHVHRSELAREYAGADIFCLPSRQEGFGIVFVEAMAAGLPIVALAASSTAELVIPGVNGLLATDDPHAVAACLSRLISEPSLTATMGATNRTEALRWEGTRSVAIFLSYADRARAASGRT